MLDEPLHPITLQRFSRQQCNRCFALASATLVATMMLEQDQIEGLLGHLTCGAMKLRSDPCIDHCNQR
jgi:hypothetical protein